LANRKKLKNTNATNSLMPIGHANGAFFRFNIQRSTLKADKRSTSPGLSLINPKMVWERKARPHPGLLPQGEGETVAAPWQNNGNGFATIQPSLRDSCRCRRVPALKCRAIFGLSRGDKDGAGEVRISLEGEL
jgi:hypothetical protein